MLGALPASGTRNDHNSILEFHDHKSYVVVSGPQSTPRGKAGANTAADHIEVLDAALAQVPDVFAEDPLR